MASHTNITNMAVESSAQAFMTRSKSLSYKEAVSLLQNHQEHTVYLSPPVKPNGGELFFVSSGNREHYIKNWMCDQYKWPIYNGIVAYPTRTTTPVVKKVYHKLGKTQTFQRHGWYLVDNPHIVLIHYLGDESEYVPTPHGNAKTDDKEYIRTCPSVLKNISDSTKNSSSTTYQELATAPCEPELNPVLRPRNLKQVQNKHQQDQQIKRLSRDDIYNLHLVAHDLHDFVLEIVSYPELTCFVGLREILNEFNSLLQTKSDSDTLVLSYDTTFNIGDFYVTPVIFRHIMFKDSPCIPLAFMLHQRKYQSIHEDFFRILRRKIPQLKTSKVPIITDRERGIVNAISSELPSSNLLLCWNHLKQDFRRWLRNHGAASDEVKVYMDDLNTLLNCDSEDQFDTTLEHLTTRWTASVTDYFNKNLKKDITLYAAKWILTPLQLYTPHSGITNNTAESMNTVLKRLMNWKEVPLDTAVLSFYFLQNYYLNEIMRGLCNTGNFQLRPQFKTCAQPSSEIDFPKNIIQPQDIVDRIKSDSITLTATEQSDQEKTTDSQTETPPTISQLESPPPPPDSQTEIPLPESNKTTTQTVPPTTQAALAQEVLDQHRIHQVPDAQAFIIQSTKGEKYCVSLFPKEKCSCPAVSTCYHIMAAKKSVGIPIEPTKKTISLSQLARNARSTADKKSGRKKPRKNDYDIIPAPDAKRQKTDPTCSDHVSDMLQLETESKKNPFITNHAEIDILTTSDWLSDTHINAASFLIKSTQPDTDGLQDVLLQKTFQCPKNKTYIQIFHVNNNHWLTASNINAPRNTINIYDSAMTLPTTDTLNLLARHHHSEARQITYQMMNVDKQPNSYDCGVYAIAFAKTLASSQDPTQKSYHDIRQHLHQALLNNNLEEFPSTQTERKPVYKKIRRDLYCDCRGIDDGSSMIQCDGCENWFHNNCVLGQKKVPRGQWFCKKC